MEDSALEKFDKHVPRILRKQLISDAVNQILSINFAEDHKLNELQELFQQMRLLDGQVRCCRPSIERFHATLLFVDISGFTILSQKLNVDQLRSFINAYFKKLIDIVHKYDGEVVKFAGDALFIIWQTKVDSLESPDFTSAARKGVLNAVACGMEINANCSDYKVDLVGDTGYHNQIIENVANSRVNRFSIESSSISQAQKKSNNSSRKSDSSDGSSDKVEPKEKVAYLNVHSGLSVGLMAGLDVGHGDRWEYLLLGDPLLDVAEAESQAGKGELVISKAAHQFLHLPEEFAKNFDQHTIKNIPPCKNCTCFAMKHEFCKVIDQPKVVCKNEVMEMEEELNANTEIDDDALETEYNLKLYSEIAMDIYKAYRTMKSHDHFRQGSDDISSIITTISNPKMKKMRETEVDDKIFNFVLKKLQHCLVDDIIRHAHEATRFNYHWVNTARHNSIPSFYNEYKTTLLAQDHRSDDEKYQQSDDAEDECKVSFFPTDGSVEVNATARHSSFVQKTRQVSDWRRNLKQKYQARNEKSLQSESATLAELREVITLFINVKLKVGKLHVSADQSGGPTGPSDESKNTTSTSEYFKTSQVGEFFFMKRTAEEIQQDYLMLKGVQDCMTVLTSCLKRQGGQMRQFIIDDKGTVCIGTFGIRGSTSHDIAAAAVIAAKSIVEELRDIGIEASIGVTSGRVYCGLVGSPTRHEYAVMGPSVNLSARLMGKAKFGEILCDNEIRGRDRVHMYEPFAQIQAKGYAYPVHTFKPIFKSDSGIFQEATDEKQKIVHAIANVQNPLKEPVVTSATSSALSMPKKIGRQVSQNSPLDKVFRGRDSEIRRMIKLLKGVCNNPEELESKLHPMLVNGQQNAKNFKASVIVRNRTDYIEAAKYFDTQASSRFVVITGSNGVGKSFLAKEFCLGVQLLGLKSPSWNISVYANDSVKYQSSDPYFTWKAILMNMLVTYGGLLREENMFGINGIFSAEERREMAIKGVEVMMERLAPEIQELRPLLVYISGIFKVPETPTTEKMSNAERMNALSDLLVAMINRYILCIQQVLVFYLDDIQRADYYSLKVLERVSTESKGIIVVLTLPSLKVSSTSPLASFLTPQVVCTMDACQLVEDFLLLELQAFSKETSFKIIEDTYDWYFPSIGKEIKKRKNLTNKAKEKIFSISNGNVFYLYEITKAICHQFMYRYSYDEMDDNEDADAEEPESPSTKGVLVSSDRFVDTIHIGMVEEMINMRFDVLSYPCQMILKLISIASSNHTLVSFPMLAYVLKHSNVMSMLDSMSPREDLTEIMITIESYLQEVLNTNQFISMMHQRPSLSEADMQLLASSASSKTMPYDTSNEGLEETATSNGSTHKQWGQYFLSFQIDLEQNAIYNLMVEDFKASIHDVIARYLEAEREMRHMSSANQWVEEAYHWMKGRVYSSAMIAYHQAALVFDSLGSFQESRRMLLQGYQMIHLMRLDAKVMLNEAFTPAQFQTLLDEIRSNKDESTELKPILPGSITTSTHQSLGGEFSEVECGKVDIFRTMDGDADLLEVALNVLLKLGQSCLTADIEATIISKIFEEALFVMTVSRKRAIDPDTPAELLQEKEEKEIARTHKLLSKLGLHDLQAKEVHDFALKDPSICFPILSGIVVLYRTKRLPDDADRSKERSTVELFLSIAKTDPVKYKLHLVKGYAYLRNVDHAVGKVEEGLALIDDAKALYSYPEQGQLSTKIYGSDRIPCFFAQNLQVLILRGDLVRGVDYMETLENLVHEVDHLHSLAMMVIPMSIAYLQVGKVRDAYRAYCAYLDMEHQRPNIYSQFKDVNKLLKLYLQLEIRDAQLFNHQQGNKTTILDDWDISIESSTKGSINYTIPKQELYLFINNILEKEYLIYPVSTRNFAYVGLDLFGFGLEYTCAKTLFMQAKFFLHQVLGGVNSAESELTWEKIKYYLETAVIYCEYYIPVLAEDNNYVLSSALTLTLLVECLIFLLKHQSHFKFSDDVANTYYVKIQNAVSNLLHLVASHQYHYLKWVVADLYKAAPVIFAAVSNHMDTSAKVTSEDIINKSQSLYGECKISMLSLCRQQMERSKYKTVCTSASDEEIWTNFFTPFIAPNDL